MLQQLNQYLFQFRALSLPHFGTIRLVAQPARLDVVEHLIYAPEYAPQFSADEELSAHQLQYFSYALQKDSAAVEAYFTKAGEALMQKLQSGTFNWIGIGTFTYNNEQVSLNPQTDATLAPVPAHRVMREKVQHSVLVGDQMVISDPAAERIVEEEKRRNWMIVMAWVLGVLALLFIGYYLYQNHFSPQASGSQIKVQPVKPSPTWQ